MWGGQRSERHNTESKARSDTEFERQQLVEISTEDVLPQGRFGRSQAMDDRFQQPGKYRPTSGKIGQNLKVIG
jgi:hypothetical protein